MLIYPVFLSSYNEYKFCHYDLSESITSTLLNRLVTDTHSPRPNDMSNTKYRKCAAHSIPGSSPTNACIRVCKYVDHKRSAAMLAIKRSAGVIP